jgi:hypothetical protein
MIVRVKGYRAGNRIVKSYVRSMYNVRQVPHIDRFSTGKERRLYNSRVKGKRKIEAIMKAGNIKPVGVERRVKTLSYIVRTRYRRLYK